MRRKIFRFRYSLKFFLLLVTVVSLIIGSVVGSAKHQERTVCALRDKAVGATVFFDSDESKIGFWQREPRDERSWLRSKLGRHYFDSAIRVELEPPDFSGDYAAAIRLIRELPQLTQITCGWYGVEHPIDDSLIEQLLNANEWEVFNFRYDENTVKTLELLGNNRSITHLGIVDSRKAIDMEALVTNISKMKQLRRLLLTGRIEVTDDQRRRLEEALPKTKMSLGRHF